MHPPEKARFDHGKVLKGVFYLMTGNVIGQVINLLGLPIIARIYLPADVGLWAVFIGIGFMVQFVAGLHYDLAVVIVDDDRDAARLAVLGMGVSTVMAVLAEVFFRVLFLFDFSWITPRLHDIAPGYMPYIFLYGIFNAATAWAIRKRAYPWLMITRFSVPLFTLILQFTFQDNHLVGNGLILGTLGAYAVMGVWGLGFMYKSMRPHLSGHAQALLPSLKSLAIRERGFPLYSIPRALIVSFAKEAVVLILGFFYTLSVVGAFNMAYRALYSPMVLIGTALAQALMPSLSEVKNEIRKFERQLLSIVRLLAWIYLPMLAFIIFHGPQAFVFVFGKQWAHAGVYAGYLSMAMLGAGLTIWFEKIFDILDRQRLHLILGFWLNAGCLLVYMLAHWLTHDPEIMVLAWSASMLAYAAIWLGVACHVCGFDLKALGRVGGEMLVLSVVLMAGVAAAVKLPLIPQIEVLVAGFTLYGVAAWFALRRDVHHFLNGSASGTGA